MYHPTSRVLTVLELLQTHPKLNAAEIAARLEVDVRTVRRYVQTLQDMAIPIEAEAGRYGGYRLRPGFKMPPLMLNDEEALTVACGLLLTQKTNFGVSPAAIEGASAKLERTLPESLRAEFSTFREAVTLDIPSFSESISRTLTLINRGIKARNQLEIVYQTEHGQTRRLIDPYGVIYHGDKWYLVAYCHLRDGLRTFRLSQIQSVVLCQTKFEKPLDFDPLKFLLESIAAIPDRWDILVLLETTILEAQKVVPRQLATLETHPDGVLFRASMPDLRSMARMLVGFGFPLKVMEPSELRDEFHKLAHELMQV